ncbi:MAG: hypothetical protein ACYDH3_13470, partial [Candidatus Aminicenantales bacterium]
RLANFKNWKGTRRAEYSDKATFGWSDQEPSVQEDAGGENWSGQGWSYDESWPDLAGKIYSHYGILENAPDEMIGTNVRKAEININGLAVRIGIRITFFLGRGQER